MKINMKDGCCSFGSTRTSLRFLMTAFKGLSSSGVFRLPGAGATIEVSRIAMALIIRPRGNAIWDGVGESGRVWAAADRVCLFPDVVAVRVSTLSGGDRISSHVSVNKDLSDLQRLNERETQRLCILVYRGSICIYYRRHQSSSSESSSPSNSIANKSLLHFISSLSTSIAFTGVSSRGRRTLRGLRALSGVKGILGVFGRRARSGDAKETDFIRFDSPDRRLGLECTFSLSSYEFSLSSSEVCGSSKDE